MKSYKSKISVVLYIITVIFTACIIVSNVLAVKIFHFYNLALPAAVIVFPITYIFGDVLTEVYGYKHARLVIWLGFFGNLIFVIFIMLGEKLPPANYWKYQNEFSIILGSTSRILIASFCAYLSGEFLNSYVMARIKIITKGKYLWVRTIGSTLVGQFADSCIFIFIAFSGDMATQVLLKVIISQWLFKVIFEIICTPITYFVINRIKKIEKIEIYDYDTSFNPFKITDLS